MKLQEKLWTLKLIALFVGNQTSLFGECEVSEDIESCLWGFPSRHPMGLFFWLVLICVLYKKIVIVGTALS